VLHQRYQGLLARAFKIRIREGIDSQTRNHERVGRNPIVRETGPCHALCPCDSFSGKLISLVWALELVVLPKGASTRQEIKIGPGAKEVRLPDVK